MWGSRHRKMACRGCRGDGSHEERQDAVLPEPTAQPVASNSHMPDASGNGSAAGGQESSRGYFFPP